MAKYELGAVYKINAANDTAYYVRMLTNDYGVFSPFGGEVCEETLSETPYQLYICCNSFAVKRGIWEKVLPSPDPKDIERWKSPGLANYGNYDPTFFAGQRLIWYDGNTHRCDKDKFLRLVRSGMIKNLFDKYEVIPSFLDNYYVNWPNSYILDKAFILNGIAEHQKKTLKTLDEMGFDTATFVTTDRNSH